MPGRPLPTRLSCLKCIDLYVLYSLMAFIYKYRSIVLVFLVLCSTRILQGAPDERTQILFLHSYHKSLWTDKLTEGYYSVLSSLPDTDFHIEYMDTKKLMSDQYLAALLSIYTAKYDQVSFDIVITSDDNAFHFALANQQEVLNNSPIVFCGVNRFGQLMLADNTNVTGVIEKGDFDDTLACAADVFPNARSLYIVCDSTRTAQINLQGLLSSLKKNKHPFSPIVLQNLSVEELKNRCASLPDNSLLFFISFWQDSNGKPVLPDELEDVFRSAAVPVFGRSEWMLGKGILGGKCVSGFHTGIHAADMAVQILSGAPAASIPVNLKGGNQFLFDYELLQKFKVNPSRLPADSIIINQPHSFYREYKEFVWAISFVIFVLASVTLALGIDVAKRKQTENALRISEIQYRRLFEYSPISLLDEDFSRVKTYINQLRNSGLDDIPAYFAAHPDELSACSDLVTVVNANKAAVTLLKARSKEDLLKGFNTVLTPDSYSTFSDILTAFIEGFKTFEKETELVSLKGDSIKTVVNISIAPGYEATWEKVLISITDITERSFIEEQLQQSHKMEAVGQLAGGIAHDFNNMLYVITGYSEILLEEYDTQSHINNYLRIILDTARRATNLTSQLLTFSRKQNVEFETLDLHDVIDDALALLSHSIDRRIDIFKSYSATEHAVHGNHSQLQNVFLNLGLNARDAMPDGGTISVSTRSIVHDDSSGTSQLPAGNYIEIVFRDTGIGMQREIQKRIFDPFFTTKEMGKGTGLGLASVYGIITHHAGAISVDSEPGNGSMFTIWLPQAGIGEKPVSDVFEKPIAGSGCILVIDDEEDVRTMLQTILSHLGYSVLLAENGESGLTTFNDHKDTIDAVILDLIMPVMNGEECFRAIRSVNPETRIILSSGYAEDTVIDTLLKEANVWFIQKPYTHAQLSRLLARIII
jgi:two-component system cell cycle sensor histidine kinase/response regulator CckA